MGIVRFFDYIYFRVACGYGMLNCRGNDPTFSAAIVIAVLQGLLILDVYAAGAALQLYKPPAWAAVSMIPVAGVLMLLNWYRYLRRHDMAHFRRLYGAEAKLSRRIKGAMIFLFYLAALGFPLLYGAISHGQLKW